MRVALLNHDLQVRMDRQGVHLLKATDNGETPLEANFFLSEKEARALSIELRTYIERLDARP